MAVERIFSPHPGSDYTMKFPPDTRDPKDFQGNFKKIKSFHHF